MSHQLIQKELFMQIEGNVCAPLGFKASGVAANIRGKNPERKDLALIFSEKLATAAAVFTQNKVKAAPVILGEALLKKGKGLQAVVINSRCANACTGEQGLKDAQKMSELTAQALHISPDLVCVASTGVIGVLLPMDRIAQGIADAADQLNENGGLDCAEAILTTDKRIKETAIRLEIGENPITIGGVAKGSGMIHPNMATTLGMLTTDAQISQAALKKALDLSVAKTFNMISVDGDTSTNDMLLVMANGLANNPIIEIDSPDFEIFTAALEHVLRFLAIEVVRDGEGTTKMFELRVLNAVSDEEARIAVKTISTSLLVKTAIFGSDPNWGRIICALGYSGINFDPNKTDLSIGSVPVFTKGMPLPFDEDAAKEVLSQKEMTITIDLHMGKGEACGWGCDLTYDYVKINGSYRS
ncbi:MAG: bifunctional ornithine acetyltransferase/N-acetylglutamate synthase [Parachlamydiaceae bacterium]